MSSSESREQPSARAIVALVLGILGLVQILPCIGSLGAVAFGWGEKEGVGRAGLILGWIGLALYALAALVLLFLVLLGGLAALPLAN